MSHKPLAWVDEKDEVHVHAVPAFWAVMLAGRDNSNLANIGPFWETYYVNNPVTVHWGQWHITQGLHAKFPFLSNTKEIERGQLLVLPFDGGCAEMFCERFPPIQAISHK